MRILTIVTLVSPLGEYGGPLRVALNQSKALAGRGHEVTIAGSYRGFESAPVEVEGIPAKLFPAVNVVPRSGFAGLAAPRLWAWLAGAANSFDVAHIHAARDLVTLPAARMAALRRLRYFVQPHGMIDESNRLMARPLDIALTVPVLKRADRVFYLTDRERCDLSRLVPGARTSLAEMPNGVPAVDDSLFEDRHCVEVLYLARLASRKRPGLFVHVAEMLAREFPGVRFSLVGPDEGEGEAVTERVRKAAAQGVPIAWEGAVPPAETINRMRRSSIYVLPSVDEPYPMSVLEAMSVALPVVITESCGLAEFVQRSQAGIVVDHGEESMVAAVRKLLSDPTAARRMGERGRDAVRAERGMTAIASLLEDAYGV